MKRAMNFILAILFSLSLVVNLPFGTVMAADNETINNYGLKTEQYGDVTVITIQDSDLIHYDFKNISYNQYMDTYEIDAMFHYVVTLSDEMLKQRGYSTVIYCYYSDDKENYTRCSSSHSGSMDSKKAERSQLVYMSGKRQLDHKYFKFSVGYAMSVDENGTSSTEIADLNFVHLFDLIMPQSELMKTKSSLNEDNSKRLSSAYINGNILNNINLVNTYRKYYLTNKSNFIDKVTGEKMFNMVCTLEDGAEVPTKYQLYKGTELICESADGKFSFKEDKFKKNNKIIDGDVFVNLIYADGSNEKTKLQLGIFQSEDFNEDSELTLLGNNTLDVTVQNDIPIIGGSNFSISSLNVPIYMSQKSDGTVRIGVNLVNKDILDSDSEWNNFVNYYEQNKKLSDHKLNKYTKDVLNKKNLKYLTKYLKTIKNKNFKLFDPNGEINIIVAGYGEGKFVGEGTEIELSITVGFEAEGSFEWQTFIVSVPIVIDGSLKGSGNVIGSMKDKYDTDKNSWDLTGELLLNFEVGVDIFAGVGVKKVASVGVNGGGKINGQITVLSNKKSSGLDTLDATLYAGIKVKFLIFDYSKNIAEKTWNLYSREPVVSSVADAEALSDIYDQSEYVLSCYDAEETIDKSVTGETENNSVISGLECSASPQIISMNNGILMTYLSEDVDRGAANATVLKYMFYDNKTGTWTDSEQVDSDNTADWYSKLYNFNEKTYLVYSQAGDTFDEDVEITDMLSSMKITVAEYDAESNKFVNITDISNANGRYNSMPELASIDKKLTAVWVNSSAEDMFNQNTSNSVQYSIYLGGEWSSPATAASGLPTVTSLCGGDLSDGAFIAASVDKDSDLSTVGDSQIIIFDMNGNTNIAAEGNVDNVQYNNIPSLEQNGFTWYDNGSIMYKLTSDTAETLSDKENSAVTSDYLIVTDRIFFVYTDADGKSSVFQTVYDSGKWTSPIQVEQADGFISAYTANEDVIIYSDTVTDKSDAAEQTTAIDMYRYASKYDIMTSAIDFDYTQIIPGKQMNIDLYLTNNTNSVLDNANVTIKNSSEEILSNITVECNIAPGEYGVLTVPFTVPAVVDNSKFTVYVEGNIEDTKPENNSIEFSLGKTELSLSVHEKFIDYKCYYVAEIANESNISTSGTFNITDSSGEVVYTQKIDSIPANETTYHIVNLNSLSKNVYSDTLKCTILSDTEEYYTNNNTVNEYAENLNGTISCVSVAFIDDKGNDIVRGIYRTGSDIIPPSYPQGTNIWVLLGDETNTPVVNFENIRYDMVYVAKKAPLPKAYVEEPTAKPIKLGQTLGDSELTSGWIWVDSTIKPETVGDANYKAYMTVSDFDKYDYSDIAGYNESTHKITRSISVKTVNIIEIQIQKTNVMILYGTGSELFIISETASFNDVTIEMVEWMYENDTSCKLLADYVNAFVDISSDDSYLLTDAQLKAIEYVLIYDNSN